jgi:hypothetical protein
MNSILVSVIVFICVFGGAMLGLYLRAALPEPHLSGDSRDAVKIGMALVATMAAIVLGLLVSSAKSSYDALSTEMTDLSAKIVLLDRVLEHYGPETKDCRESLRSTLALAIDRFQSGNPNESARLEPQVNGAESVFDKIQALTPKNESQRMLQTRASSLAFDLLQTRWLMYEQSSGSISVSLLVCLVFWLVALFVSFGLFAPPNATVIASFLVCALSVSAAIFLIVEMYQPYGGIIHVSSAPLHTALSHLGR